MKILKLQTLNGPNYWSIYSHRLVELRLDLEALDTILTNEVVGFDDGLIQLLPGLATHGCVMGYPGEFLERVRSGISLAEVVEHVALELQTLAGMSVQFGRTGAAAIAGVYQVAVEYQDERVGRLAVRAAVDIVQSLCDRGEYPAQDLAQDLADLSRLGAAAKQQMAEASPGVQASIPTIAVMGRHYRTTTARLTTHLFRYIGRGVHHTTAASPASYIFPRTGKCVINQAAKGSTIDVTVLETSMMDILRSGLAVDHVDVSVILDTPQIPLGFVHTVDDLMLVESVVVEATVPQGYVVLNADEPLIVNLAQRASARVAYFSMNPFNPVIWEHVRQGGLVAIYEDGYLSIIDGDRIMRVEQVSHVPATRHGVTPILIGETLAAMLVAYVQGISIPNIRAALNICSSATEPLSQPLMLGDRWSKAWSKADYPVNSSCSLRE
ncbi:cyanophycin synthetase family protein [Pantanalinema rosaneae CENA516]|uniref:cyanophycin synthetase family protein n=1 Tax=Pantanalinema rosaneae TaxID=1620701 RepID=UPI003D6F7A56